MSFRFLLFFVASLICNGCLSDFSVTWDDVMISLGNEFKDDGQMNNIRKDHYRVYEVIDGDTFWVLSDDNKQIKIRLIGVDAPETQNAPMFAFYKHRRKPLTG
jgi:endonuclease YncB( thermonuclease family)